MKQGKAYFFLFIFLFFCLLPLAKGQGTHWSSFLWVKDSIPETNGHFFYSNHAGILIPISIEIDNKDLPQRYMQLDLGAKAKLILYGIPLLQLKAIKPPRNLIKTPGFPIKYTMIKNVKAKLAHFSCNIDTSILYSNFGDSVKENQPIVIIGSIGAGFFKNHILILNFVNNKFLIVNKFSSLPKLYQDKSKYEKITITPEGHLSIPIQLGDTSLQAIYDTGASPLDVTLPYSLWKKLTGRKGNEPDNIYLKAHGWGQQNVAIGYALKTDSLKIADYYYKSPVLYAIIGNKIVDNKIIFSSNPFIGKCSVVIDQINNKFAVFKK